MLMRILVRARELCLRDVSVPSSSPVLDFFLQHKGETLDVVANLDKFCLLDDYDVMGTIKSWMFHSDQVLSLLSRCLIDRRLLKVRFQATPFEESYVQERKREVAAKLGISTDDAAYFAFMGEAVNTTYDPMDEKINILFRDGSVKDISQVDNALIRQTLASTVKKYYFCFLNT
jgi:transcription termination factor NusB